MNPYLARAFEIREFLGLSESADRLRDDPVLRRLFLAPQESIFSAPFVRSVPGLAFWLLAALSLLSFALHWKTWPLDRLLTWLSLFLLCLLTVRAAPFFSIGAGLILAFNWATFWAWDSLRIPMVSSSWAVIGRGVVFLALLVLAVLAWPGWLQNDPGPRRWTIEMEPSLAEAGKEIAKWRNEGVLQAGHHGFHFSPEAANTFPWLCPDEMGFLNAHRNVPAAAIADYIAVRNGLMGDDNKWRSILRSRGISYVVLYNNDQRLSEKVIHQLMGSPKEWPLVYQRGRVAIFAWHDRNAANSSPAPAFKPLRLDERAFSFQSEDRAPASWPGRAPAPFQKWDTWWRPRPDRLLDADEARQQLTLFHASRPAHFKKIKKAWLPLASSRAAGVVALAGSPLSGWPRGVINLVGAESLFPVMIQEQLFYSAHDLGPSAPLYLAIRAARRALRDDPDSAAAYLALGDAYFLLARLTRERSYQFPLLVQTRSIQAIAAYQQALLLNPGLESARRNLVDLYQRMGYLDLMLEQLQAMHSRRQALAASSEEAQKQTAMMAKELEAFAKEVKDLEDKFALSSSNNPNLKVLDRARLANKLGLPGAALKILLASDLSAFGGPGLELELRLLLETGKLKDVRDWFKPIHERDLGTSLYYQTRAKLGAAGGDYDQADRDLEASLLKLSDLAKQPMSLRDGGAFMVGSAVLHGASGGPFAKISNEILRLAPLKKTTLLLPDHGNLGRYMWELNLKIAEEARVNVLRGLLALEAGNLEHAQRVFRVSLRFWQSPGGMVFPDPESLSCRLIAQQWLAGRGQSLITSPRK